MSSLFRRRAVLSAVVRGVPSALPALLTALFLTALFLTALFLTALFPTALPAAAAAESSPSTVAGWKTSAGVWPLDPRPEIVEPFAPPEQPWLGGHRGVDLAGALGQPVRAGLDGTVSFVGRVAGVGVVVVDHGSTRTTYQPVTASVGRGDTVEAGERIGTLAWYGTHCLPRACLHWGWLRGEEYLDPLDLVGGGPQPVRLLPLAVLPGPGGALVRLDALLGGWSRR